MKARPTPPAPEGPDYTALRRLSVKALKVKLEPGRELKIDLPSTLPKLALVRQAIRRFTKTCKLPSLIVDKIELAVDEAVANAVEHAYPDREDGLVQVKAWREPRRFSVSVRDYGKGYNAKPVSFAAIRKVMRNHLRRGMGRYLMRQCMDIVQYTTLPQQYNETFMVKRLPR
ncbi:MAG: ATP-binding protein [candidate division FCPU426 bacterium]